MVVSVFYIKNYIKYILPQVSPFSWIQSWIPGRTQEGYQVVHVPVIDGFVPKGLGREIQIRPQGSIILTSSIKIYILILKTHSKYRCI